MTTFGTYPCTEYIYIPVYTYTCYIHADHLYCLRTQVVFTIYSVPRVDNAVGYLVDLVYLGVQSVV